MKTSVEDQPRIPTPHVRVQRNGAPGQPQDGRDELRCMLTNELVAVETLFARAFLVQAQAALGAAGAARDLFTEARALPRASTEVMPRVLDWLVSRGYPGRAGAAPGGCGGGGDDGLRRPGGGPKRPDGGRRGGDRGGPGAALLRLCAMPAGRMLTLHRRLAGLDIAHPRFAHAVERARDAMDRMEAEHDYKRRRVQLLWGRKDIWGIPLT